MVTTGLHYEIAGDGAPLLWVHGFLGAGCDWRHLFGEPPAGFRLIAPDLPGHGRSPAPARFSFRESADELMRLLDDLRIPTIKGIGLSGGGITLLHLAALAPDRVSAMVLVSVPPRFPEQARVIQRQFSEAMLPPEELAAMRQRHPGGPEQIAQLFDWCRGLADDDDDVAFTPDRLAVVRAETLVVFGDRDPLYSVQLALELSAAIPRSYLWVLPNAGHVPVFGEASAQFGATALPFLRGEWNQPGR